MVFAVSLVWQRTNSPELMRNLANPARALHTLPEQLRA